MSKSTIRFIAKSILATLLSAIGLVLLTLVILVTKPEILINPTTMRWGSSFARKSGMDLKWKSGDLHTHRLALLARHFDFEFSDFCADRQDGSLRSCFDKLSFAFDVSFKSFPPKLTTLGPIAVLGGEMAYDPSKVTPQTNKKKDQNTKTNTSETPAWFKDLKIEQVKVDIRKWLFKSESGDLAGNFEISGESSPSGSHWVIQAVEKMAQSPQAHHARMKADLKNPGNAWLGPWTGSGDAKARFEDGRRADLAFRVQQKEGVGFDYVLDATYAQARQLIDAKVQGKLSNESITADLNATVHHLAPHLPLVTVTDCDLSLRAAGTQVTRAPEKFDEKSDEKSERAGKFKLNCPLVATLRVPPVKGVPKFKWPTKTGMRLIADLNTGFYPSASEPLDGRIEVQLEPILTPILQGGGSAIAQVSGIPNEFPTNWKFDSELALNASVPRFQTIVDMLHQTSWPIPAPLNELDGSVEMGARGKVDLSGGVIPIQMKTRLSSKIQKLNLDSSGVLKLVKSEQGVLPSLQLKVALSDIQLVLPKLDLKSPPRFFPDARIHQLGSQLAKAAKSTLDYHVEIFTPPGHQLTLLSNLAKAPVPITLDFKVESDKTPTGQMNIAGFPLELFRRQATLEHFKLSMAQDDEDQDIDGSIRVDYTDYTIHVLLMGTSKAPVVKLVSDPPLAEDQLVAVLLFGHPLSELDPEQSTSVGDTRAALTDGAVGLASLYVLASTPIQSVGYDPATGVVSAKVRLGEGMSLNVGASSTESDIGIRKRLGKHWSINTGVTRQTENGDANVASAYLEWNNRY